MGAPGGAAVCGRAGKELNKTAQTRPTPLHPGSSPRCLPSSHSITFALDGSVQYNILDAYDIAFEVLTFANGLTSGSNQQFNNNYSSLANGSPVKGNGAVLVE